jgi:hypothetical protein
MMLMSILTLLTLPFSRMSAIHDAMSVDSSFMHIFINSFHSEASLAFFYPETHAPTHASDIPKPPTHFLLVSTQTLTCFM